MSKLISYSKFILPLMVALLMMVPSYADSSMPDFTQLMENASPAVVSIVTLGPEHQRKQLVPDDLMNELEQTPLMDALKEIWGNDVEKKLYGEQEPGIGSGTVISSDGYVLTNYHVVANAEKIYVHFKNKRDYVGTLIGFDKGTDLALLKINAKRLPYIEMAPEPVKVGQWVIAIGAPYGFEDTLTVGVVSAKRRSLGAEKYVPYIQSDVAINPGNSGGPLLNLKGQMVGINSQIVSQSGGYSGLSFSVPVSVAQSVIEQIKNQGFVERGWLGLAFQDLNRQLAKSFGIPAAKGALISKVVEQSPAFHAGLKVGDVVVSMNEKDVRNASDIPPIVGLLPIGSRVKVGVIRSHKELSLDLVIGRSPKLNDATTTSLSYAFFNKAPEQKERGINVREWDPSKDSFIQAKDKGVVVSSLDNFAWRTSGLRKGDVILRMNGEEISEPKMFYRFIDDLPKDQTFSLLIARKGEIQRFIAINRP